MRRLVPLAALCCLPALPWACRFEPADDSGEGPDTGDSPPPDSTPDDTAPETGDTRDTEDSGPPAGDFALVSEDFSTWASEGYLLAGYALDPGATEPYPSLFADEAPSFRLLLPSDAEPKEELPLLVWLHDGALGDDSSATPDGCALEDVEAAALAAAATAQLPTAVALRRRWAVVVPRDDWCDGWLGHGPDDPVDPAHHLGSYHLGRVLTFLASGAAGFTPGPRYAWGAGAGGHAALVNAVRFDGFEAVIADSSPSSPLLAWGADPASVRAGALLHVLGGPPYDKHGQTVWYDSWVSVSAEHLVDNGRLDLPVFLLWNSLDLDVPPAEPEALIAAIEARYAAGPRHGSVDLAHRAPGERYHVQGLATDLPGAYLGAALASFLEGTSIGWTEAEEGCGGAVEGLCTTGATVTSAEDPTLEAWSAAGARRTTAADGIGTFWCTRIPANMADGDTVEATFALVATANTAESPSDPLLTASYREGASPLSEATLRSVDFLAEGAADVADTLAQVAATRLSFTTVDAGSGVLCLTAHARATLALDGVIYGIEGR